MKIRPITPGHIINCPYCKVLGDKVQAVWHLTLANKQSCDKHRPQLQALLDADINKHEDYSEADYQTWMRV